MAAKFGVLVDEDHSKFPHYNGYLNFLMKYCETVMERNCKIHFGLLRTKVQFLIK